MSTHRNPLRIGFVPVARPTFDTALAAEMTDRVRSQLAGAGCQLIGPGDLAMDAAAAQAAIDMLADQPIDLLLVLQASFADSTMLVELARGVDAPLMMWAVPEERTGGRLRLNSFCGINLGAHGLTRAGTALRLGLRTAGGRDGSAQAADVGPRRACQAAAALGADRADRRSPGGF